MLPRLLVITDARLPWERNEAAVRELACLGPRLGILYREPGAGGRCLLERAQRLQTYCEEAGVPLFVHGRLDVALRVRAHLHLPVEAPSPAEVRPHLPPGRWVSTSVHDLEERDHALRAGANLLLVSPVFPPGSKPQDGRRPLGLEGFSALVQDCPVPVYALGGLTTARAASVAQRVPGAGLAVMSAVLTARFPRTAAEALLEALPPPADRGSPLA